MRVFAAMTIAAAALVLGACKGSSHSGATSSAGSNTIAGAASNVVTATVSAGPGPTASINTLYTTVRICAPGSTTNCQTIDGIQVDTGTSGLRVLASVLSPALAAALPLQVDANNSNIVECAQFADGYAWGPVATADLHISGETAASLPMQIVGSTQFPTAPAPCAATGAALDSVASLGANGTLGLSTFVQDCGSACALSLDTAVNPGYYYACAASTSCVLTTVPIAGSPGPTQVVNPVTLFALDNNGVIVELPAVGATGAGTTTGALVFGIDTATNNVSSTSTPVLTLDPVHGYIGTTLNSIPFPRGFFDTGSKAIYFDAPSLTALTACTGAGNTNLYCPSSTTGYAALVDSSTNILISINFSVANADTLLTSAGSLVAFSNLAGQAANPISFDWGLPFYFGRNVYTAIEGKGTTLATGPYIAF